MTGTIRTTRPAHRAARRSPEPSAQPPTAVPPAARPFAAASPATPTALPAAIPPALPATASTGPALLTRMLKRAMDAVGAFVLLALLSPLLAVVALAVTVSSPGGALYCQERVGKDRRLFTIFKFRTMCDGADAQLRTLLAEQGHDRTPLFKVDDDPRITRLGRLLRRTSIDELPQLVNVLIGQMSLVGPRPQRPAEVAMYDAFAAQRLTVRPGMTGLWQVSGRSRLGWEEAVAMDVHYARSVSLRLDLSILARTVGAVIRSDGAQ